MNKMAAIGTALLLLAGCATTSDRPLQSVVTLSTGDMVEYVQVDGKDPSGINTRTVDRYIKKPNGELVLVPSGYSGQGILNNFFQGGFAGLAQGAGFAGGMALLRPSNVSQTGGGGGGANADANSVSNSKATTKRAGHDELRVMLLRGPLYLPG